MPSLKNRALRAFCFWIPDGSKDGKTIWVYPGDKVKKVSDEELEKLQGLTDDQIKDRYPMATQQELEAARKKHSGIEIFHEAIEKEEIQIVGVTAATTSTPNPEVAELRERIRLAAIAKKEALDRAAKAEAEAAELKAKAKAEAEAADKSKKGSGGRK